LGYRDGDYMSQPIVQIVQTLINDVNVFWTQQQVLDAVNEAQMWVYVETKWQRVPGTLTVTEGQDIVSIPSTLLVPQWIEGTNTNIDGSVNTVRFFPSTQRELETFLRTWRGAKWDQPGNFILWDATHFRLFPKPDKTYTYTVWGIGWPTAIQDNVTPILGDPRYVLAVQNYAAALLFEATRPDLADMYMAQADDQILQYRKHIRNMQSHNIRRLRFGKRMDIQQSGTIRELPTYYPLEVTP
jgi:hypothetical protein